mgnify:FL=1
MSKVKIVARTVEDVNPDPSKVKEEAVCISGKAAGICYMPDDYLSNGIQDNEKALKRAKMNAESGHYSVYEHTHISFIIETDKMMAMILNSTGLYCTSEKSARYTAMKGNTELEDQLYNKWRDIFKNLAKDYYLYKDCSDTELDKIAMENARYMLSVFTPTVLEYTIPFSRAILIPEWLDNLAYDIERSFDADLEFVNKDRYFWSKVASECIELAENIRSAIGITKEDSILKDHKNMGIELFSKFNTIRRLSNIIYNLKDIDEIDDNEYNSYTDNYCIHYQASFAELAQAQRHRTLRYNINSINNNLYYIPELISEEYKSEWINDFNKLRENNIYPQGIILDIEEEGRFEEFVLKCKERLCLRAQTEIRMNTEDTLLAFAFCNNLNNVNSFILNSMMANVSTAKLRCQCKGYTCKEPCKYLKYYIENNK